MSPSETETVFAAIDEGALNYLLREFFTARRHCLCYGSPSFVPVTTIAGTSMAAVSFANVPGGIQWALRMTIPRVDLHAQSMPLPPQLTLGPGQFSARLEVELCLDRWCLTVDSGPPPNHSQEDPGRDPESHPRHRQEEGHPSCSTLNVFAIGHLQQVPTSTGEDAIALAVDAVEIVDLGPDQPGSMLESLMFMVLQAALAHVRLPLHALRVGGFHRVPIAGSSIDDDRIEARKLAG